MHPAPTFAVASSILAVLACAPRLPVSHTELTTARAAGAVTEATGAALQGDISRAMDLLSQVPAAEFQGADASFRACVLDRFSGTAPPPSPQVSKDPFVERLLVAFRLYWWRSLKSPQTRAAEEKLLLHTLQDLLQTAPGEPSFDDLERPLKERLHLSGLHALLGRTNPLGELMLWSREDVQIRKVELPDGPYTVRVLLLSGFESLGWADWATCGRRGTGGWASTDTLNAVRPRYARLDGDEFQATFLGHETQHLADLRRFPGLLPWELEYRAKLTELALAGDGWRVILGRFSENQGDDPSVPHAFADKRVLADLRDSLQLAPGADLFRVSPSSLKEAARAKLLEDTRRRELAAR
jgi:hypothetical protein